MLEQLAKSPENLAAQNGPDVKTCANNVHVRQGFWSYTGIQRADQGICRATDFGSR